MTSKRKTLRKTDAQIREILLRDWDPIGVGDRRECQDEYDAYIGSVHSLLASRVSPETLAAHLARLEGEQMGLPSSATLRLDVARKLCALEIQ